MIQKNILKITFFISILIHLIFAVLIYFLLQKIDEEKETKVEEKKVKLAFKKGGDSKKENSKFKENAPLSKPQALQSKQQQNIPQPQQNTRKEQQHIKENKESKKDSIKSQIDLSNLQVYDGNVTNQPAQPSNPSQNNSNIDISEILKNVPQDVKEEIAELYGDELGDYGDAQREFIINNLREIGRITQYHLNLRGYPPDAGYLGQSGKNAVEFYLYPNGDISDLQIILDSKSMILDKNTMKTIQIAYKDYPRPSTKTKIKIYVRYYLIYN